MADMWLRLRLRVLVSVRTHRHPHPHPHPHPNPKPHPTQRALDVADVWPLRSTDFDERLEDKAGDPAL